MTLEDLQLICEKLPGTTTDIKWEHHLCFNVGEKMYLITSPDEIPPNASFKVSEEDFVALTERPGIQQARYFARRQWVSVEDIALLNKDEWDRLIKASYKLVSAKLTKRLRTELGIE